MMLTSLLLLSYSSEVVVVGSSAGPLVDDGERPATQQPLHRLCGAPCHERERQR